MATLNQLLPSHMPASVAPADLIGFQQTCEQIRCSWHGPDAVSLRKLQRFHRLEQLARTRREVLYGQPFALGFLNNPKPINLAIERPRGLLSRAKALYSPQPSVEPTASDATTLEQRKLSRVEARLANFDSLLKKFVEQSGEAREFLRAHCAAHPPRLRCFVIDALGQRRQAHPRAWLNEDNWQSLVQHKVFESGNHPLEAKGRAFFDPQAIDGVCAHLSLVAALSGVPRGSLRDIRLSAGRAQTAIVGVQLSAAAWFREDGRSIAERNLRGRGVAITEKALHEEAAAIWNDLHPDYPRTAGAFKKAAQRPRRKGT